MVTDLWRVALGTLTSPAALGAGAAAAAWTPAVVLEPGLRGRIGVEAVHGPAETGLSGGIAAVSLRAGRATVSASYGRIGIGDVAYTETSPEAVGGAVPVWTQMASLGIAVRPLPRLTAGLAARVLGGRLGPLERSQFGLDAGARLEARPRLFVGIATQFLDPGFGASAQGAGYSVGGEYTTGSFGAWGAPAAVAVRYGASFLRGEGTQHLLVAGLTLGTVAMDWGAAREAAFGTPLWRSRFGLGVRSGGYQVQIARDGGASGFGATWRFGLTMEFR